MVLMVFLHNKLNIYYLSQVVGGFAHNTVVNYVAKIFVTFSSLLLYVPEAMQRFSHCNYLSSKTLCSFFPCHNTFLIVSAFCCKAYIFLCCTNLALVSLLVHFLYLLLFFYIYIVNLTWTSWCKWTTSINFM